MLASKYERRVDIRSFDERQRLFQGVCINSLIYLTDLVVLTVSE